MKSAGINIKSSKSRALFVLCLCCFIFSFLIIFFFLVWSTSRFAAVSLYFVGYVQFWKGEIDGIVWQKICVAV